MGKSNVPSISVEMADMNSSGQNQYAAHAMASPRCRCTRDTDERSVRASAQRPCPPRRSTTNSSDHLSPGGRPRSASSASRKSTGRNSVDSEYNEDSGRANPRPEYKTEPGPIVKRKCRDIIWLILFLLFWAAMIGVGIFANSVGHAM